MNKQKPSGYWTYERCRDKALLYDTKGAFRKACAGGYCAAQKNGWLAEICSHMRIVGNKNKRAIYAFVFKAEKLAYVGLSYDPSGNRLQSHLSNSSNPGLSYQLSVQDCEFIIFDEWHSAKQAPIIEQEIIDHFEYAGYETLNISKAGCLGGSVLKWTYENCLMVALRYSNTVDFRKYADVVYQTVIRRGWLERIQAHMTHSCNKNGYWTYERCAKKASEYTTHRELVRNCSAAYSAAQKNGWLDDICSHMVTSRKPKYYWTHERCKKEAAKYNTLKEFRLGNISAYEAAHKNDWLDDICSHMIRLQKPAGYWTYERCKKEASQYRLRSEFSKSSGSAYNIACTNGWLDDICSHMIRLQKPSGYWTYERCLDETKIYHTRSALQHGSRGAYKAALRNGWLDELFPK